MLSNVTVMDKTTMVLLMKTDKLNLPVEHLTCYFTIVPVSRMRPISQFLRLVETFVQFDFI